MRGLTIIVATADPERFHGALSIAAANAALDGGTRIFLQGEAAGLLVHAASPADEQRSRHGIPTSAQLIEEAQALGAEIIACQSGLALCGLSASDLPSGIATGGLVQVLAGLGDDQLIMA